MKIEKAIEVLGEILRFVKPADPPEEHDAIRLGIHALKRIKDNRQNFLPFAFHSLPGETTD